MCHVPLHPDPTRQEASRYMIAQRGVSVPRATTPRSNKASSVAACNCTTLCSKQRRGIYYTSREDVQQYVARCVRCRTARAPARRSNGYVQYGAHAVGVQRGDLTCLQRCDTLRFDKLGQRIHLRSATCTGSPPYKNTARARTPQMIRN